MRKVPDGYDSEDDFLAEMRARYEEAASADILNRTEAVTDLEFLAGDQWDTADVKAREGRPCLTINRLPQFIAQIVGDIRLSPPAIRVRPAEDADKDLAAIREGLIRSIENLSGASAVYTNAAQSTIACGIGNFRVVLDYATNDAFDRDIVIKRIDNPFAVLWDPYLTEPTGKDARFAFIDDMLPRKTFEKLYGEDASASDLGNIGARLTATGWLSEDAVRVTEYWIVKETPAEIAMMQDGKVEWITPENEAMITPYIAVNDRGQPMRRKTTKKTVCMYVVTGHAILEGPVEYEISRIPIFRVPGWEIQTGEKKIRFGLVRFMKDPQRLLNYWRSVQAEKLALSPRQQWIIHESQSGDQDDFRNAANSGDTVLTWVGSVAPQRLDPPQIESALIQAAEQNSQDLKDVSGLHDASLGARSNETSGRAILARQKEGDVASYIYQDNLKTAIAECGRVINEWIPQVFDKTRTVRVLGEDGAQRTQRVNDESDPESIDLSVGKFDIVVDTGPSYNTKRQEASESMLAFIQAVPQAAQVSGDLIAKAQDWPMAEEIAERLKKTLPPGMAEDEEDPDDPEVQQARQQAMQQAEQQQRMQQHAMELELAEKEADVALKQAQAQKTMAEADNVGADQGQDETELDVALKLAQLRKAEADADKAEADADKARSEAGRAEIAMHADHIAVQSDALDLEAKPTEQALAHAGQAKALEDEPELEPA